MNKLLILIPIVLISIIVPVMALSTQYEYALDYKNLSLGNHTIKAKVTDSQGNISYDSIVITLVDNENPTISIIKPAPNYYVPKNQKTLQISINAVDNHQIKKTEVYVDNIIKSTIWYQDGHIYNINTNSLSRGTHTISAIAYDMADHIAKTSVYVVKK